MSLSEIRAAYPRAYRVLAGLVELPGVHRRAVEGLIVAALARIEAGDTDARDTRILLANRSARR